MDDGRTSPLRLTVGAARIVSCVQSLHGLFETSFLIVEDEDFEGPTVGAVVAERLETVAVLEDDISSTTMDDSQQLIGVQQRSQT